MQNKPVFTHIEMGKICKIISGSKDKPVYLNKENCITINRFDETIYNALFRKIMISKKYIYI